MQDLDSAVRELRRRGKVDALRTLADSADGQRLSRMIDGAAVEQAVKTGDSAALQQILRAVMNTAEGRRLAENVRGMMEKK